MSFTWYEYWKYATGTQSSCRYEGAAPWTHFHTSRALLKVTRWRIASQWRLCRIGDNMVTASSSWH